MNTGVVSSRYARALLLLTQQDGRGQEVFRQVRALLKDPTAAPQPLSPDLAKLALLLKKNGRGEYMRFVLNDFSQLYCESTGTRLALLTTAVEAPGLPEKIARLLGGKVYMETEVDPSIEGGFVLSLGDVTLDASVKGQLERIRRQFIENNKRVV